MSILYSSGSIAKARALQTIASDRLSCNESLLLNLQSELYSLLSKYIVLDHNTYEIHIDIVYKTKQGVKNVKTIQIK